MSFSFIAPRAVSALCSNAGSIDDTHPAPAHRRSAGACPGDETVDLTLDACGQALREGMDHLLELEHAYGIAPAALRTAMQRRMADLRQLQVVSSRLIADVHEGDRCPQIRARAVTLFRDSGSALRHLLDRAPPDDLRLCLIRENIHRTLLEGTLRTLHPEVHHRVPSLEKHLVLMRQADTLRDIDTVIARVQELSSALHGLSDEVKAVRATLRVQDRLASLYRAGGPARTEPAPPGADAPVRAARGRGRPRRHTRRP
jgi:hypothetical protein